MLPHRALLGDVIATLVQCLEFAALRKQLHSDLSHELLNWMVDDC